MTHPVFPVESKRLQIESARKQGALIITAPTGSGKSTQVPRWFMAQGAVLVIEPRRVACRALAEWVAGLEDTRLGMRVGYAIRDEECRSEATRLLFVTPGVALRILVESPTLSAFKTIVIDEFHERGWQVDLLLALLKKRRPQDVIVMSATMDAGPLVGFLNATHIEAQGRRFPVTVRYDGFERLGPTRDGLSERVSRVLGEVDTPGDVLVFLPGKGEIRQVSQTLTDAIRRHYEVLPLHSRLTAAEQRAVFKPTHRQKLILSTNIAETSLTLTGVTLVIDSGLVRTSQYFQGRGFLGLVPIAQDAADQRAGRAGRVQAGDCIRLWSGLTKLSAQTQAEIIREGLTPLVLTVLECGERPDDVPFLTQPKAYALDAAITDLTALGAVDGSGDLTRTGKELARMPMDPHLGRLMVQSKVNGCAPLMVVLVSILGLQRSLYVDSDVHPADSDRFAGCDVWRVLSAYYHQDETLTLSGEDRRRIERAAKRVGQALDVQPAQAITIHDREKLAKTAVMADGRFVFLKRHRRQRVYWTNGRAEAELGHRSALGRCLDRGMDAPGAIVALEIFGLSVGHRKRTLQLNWLMPIPLSMVEHQVDGTEILSGVRIGTDGLEGRYARMHAKRELGAEWRLIPDADVHETLFTALIEGELWQASMKTLTHELSLIARHAFLTQASLPAHFRSPESYVKYWCSEVGIDTASDILLIEPTDLLPTPLAPFQRDEVLRRLPDNVSIGSKSAKLTYNLTARVATLHMDKRWVKSAINPRFLPSVEGFSVVVRDGTRQRMLRK